jgi:hypothetical protein
MPAIPYPNEYTDYSSQSPARYPYPDEEDTQEVAPIRFPSTRELESHIEERRRRIVARANAEEAAAIVRERAWNDAELEEGRRTYSLNALDAAFATLLDPEVEIARQHETRYGAVGWRSLRRMVARKLTALARAIDGAA